MKTMKQKLVNCNSNVAFFNIDTVIDADFQDIICYYKYAWISPQINQASFAFQKNSTLIPFFNYVLQEIREKGMLEELFRKWTPRKFKECKKSEDIKGISIYRVILILILFCSGILLAMITMVFEVILNKMKEQETKDP